MAGGFGRKGLPDAGPQTLEAPPRALSNAAKFDITPHPGKMLLIVAFGVVVALFCFVKLLDPRGLLINSIIELSPTGANIFFIVLTLSGLGMASLGVIGIINSFGDKVWLTLDQAAISGPRGYAGRKLVRIPYAEVASFKRQRYQNQEVLTIKAGDGRKIKVGTGNFRKQEEWPEFLEELQRRAQAS